MACDVVWYVENMGLATRGIDILNLIKKNVPMSQCPKLKKFLGPKFQRMGIDVI
jgi:hypothetical protein